MSTQTISSLVEKLREGLPIKDSKLFWLRAHKSEVLELARRWSSGRTARLLDVPTASLDLWIEAVTQGKLITEQAFLSQEAARQKEGDFPAPLSWVPQPLRSPPSKDQASPASEADRVRPASPAPRKLRKRQEQILDFVRKYTQQHGYPPVLREIQTEYAISSLSVVSYNVRQLEAKGYLRRSNGKARGIVLLGDGDATGPSPTPRLEKEPVLDARALYDRAAAEAAAEALRARFTLGFGPMHSAHEGFAVIDEERDELWAEVKGHRSPANLKAMRKEAVQVAAMAIAFIVEVCDV